MTEQEIVKRGEAIQALLAHRGWKYIEDDLKKQATNSTLALINGEITPNKFPERLENRGAIKLAKRYIGTNSILEKWIDEKDKKLR